jgi:AraC family transcriptional regulator, regulatory protein of adaptative response / methylated-DNA-[protein]-cysteine methyltransferase
MKDQPKMAFSDDAQRWHALTQRDERADDVFLYGVKTTGVYCRPTCASRRPRRENVEFFASTLEAEQAGYRPCKRCLPNATSPHEQRVAMIRRVCSLMEESEGPPALHDLAAAAGMSVSHFHRVFKEILGLTPKQYATALRRRRLQGGLAQGAAITEAIYDAGFNSSSRFYEKSTELLGMTPTRYKRGAPDLRLRVAVTRSFLGLTLVAATDQGICFIAFGDSPRTLLEHLRRRFPNAQLDQDDPGFAHWVAKVTAFIETPTQCMDLPLDIQGTAFQQRVWKALQEIPPGTTRSYTQVAAAIGKPKAVRAVARACASNRIAVAIPCHRVIRSDGDLGGYRWGLARKQVLLQREQTHTGEGGPG